MRLNRKRMYLIYGFCFVVTALISMFSYNIMSVILDPFQVIWKTQNKQDLCSGQQRFWKIEYLKKNSGKHDGFIIGNSRGFFVDSVYLAKLSGMNFYNLSTLSDTIFGYRDKVNWLLRTQNVKQVVLLLSFDQFCMGDNRFDILVTREHPEVTGEKWINYYAAFSNLPDNTFRKSLADILQFGYRIFSIILPLKKQSPPEILNMSDSFELSTGNFDQKAHILTKREQLKIEEEFGGGEKAKEFDKFLITYLNSPFQEGALASFKEILFNLKKSNVNKTCIVVPMPARSLRLVDPSRYTYWLSYLVQECGSIWDFSDSNSITRDKSNYLEWSHFLLPVGNLMFERITKSNSKKLKSHPDFGHYVDATNLNAYLQHWKTSFDSSK